MNNLDIGILLVLVISTLLGFVRGFIASFLSFFGWIAAIMLNHYIFPNIEPFLAVKFKTKIVVFILGYVGGLLVLLLVFAVINFVIMTAIGNIKGHKIDRALGSVFGFTRGILIPIVLFLCFQISITTLKGAEVKDENMPDLLLHAKTLPFLKEGSSMLIDILPDTFTMSFYSYVDMIKVDNMIKESQRVDDITMLNIIRKLSTYASPEVIDKINANVDKNNKYISKKQLRIEKIQKLWKNYQAVQHQKNLPAEKLSQEEITLIKKILQSNNVRSES